MSRKLTVSYGESLTCGSKHAIIDHGAVRSLICIHYRGHLCDSRFRDGAPSYYLYIYRVEQLLVCLIAASSVSNRFLTNPYSSPKIHLGYSSTVRHVCRNLLISLICVYAVGFHYSYLNRRAIRLLAVVLVFPVFFCNECCRVTKFNYSYR